jgi:hypothetical protein
MLADSGHQEVVAGASTHYVKQVALAVVDLFEIGILGDILDVLLRRG